MKNAEDLPILVRLRHVIHGHGWRKVGYCQLRQRCGERTVHGRRLSAAGLCTRLPQLVVAPSDAVTDSISRMPGPPTGPSPRITTMSPGLISRFWIAAKHASSPSKTLAGPVIRVVFRPAILHTAPSGARLPCRMTMCPERLSG